MLSSEIRKMEVKCEKECDLQSKNYSLKKLENDFKECKETYSVLRKTPTVLD